MHCRLLAIVVLGLLAATLPNKGFAAGPTKYAILANGPTCSIKIENTSIKSFRLLAPTDQIDKLASKGLVTVDVCECYLMPGNAQKCMLDQVRKTEFVQALKKDEVDLLAGKMYLFVENRDDFVALYMALQTSSSTAGLELASRLVQQSRAASPPPATPPSAASPPAPPPPPRAGGEASLEAEKRNRGCEVEPQICVKPKKPAEGESKAPGGPETKPAREAMSTSDGTDFTAEFEVKCEGLPPIIVSTEGKAGFKVGPLEVSISKP
jgi:hypothetical protein